MDEQTVDDFEELLLKAMGGRMAAAHERMQNAEAKAGMHHAGEADGIAFVYMLLQQYRAQEQLPEYLEKDHWQAYYALAEAYLESGEAVKQESGEPKVGVQ